MRRFRWNVLGVTVGGLVFVASAAVLPSSTSSSVAAQERDYSRRYDPKELVERLDQNKNGMVEPDEMQGRSRYFLERIAPQMGLDLTKPIPNDKLMEAVKNAPPREGSSGGPPGSGGPGGGPGSYGGPGSSGGPGGGGPGGYGGPGSSGGPGGSSSSSGSSGGGSSNSGRREEKAPLVPGFGAPSSLPKPPGFDGALAMATAAASSAESRYDRRVVEYVDRMMRDYDKNKDSQLDADEMKAVQWTGDPKESDTNRDGKLSRLELLDRIAKKWGSTTSPSSSSSGRSGSGFGSSSGSSSSSSGTSAADEAAKVRRYAEGLLKQYDANKNGVLDKDEWTQVRTITPDTDANKDGAVTIEELTAKLSGFGQQGAGSSGGSSSSSSSSGGDRDRDRDRGGFGGGGGPPGGFGGSRPGFGSSSGSSGSGSRDKNANDKNKSYRQKSPLERLPKGLPDWFARNDANADGQVSMAEFSTSWSESKAAEFAGFDLNGDGVVTPQECLKAAEKGKSGPSGSYGGSSGGGSFGSSGSGSSGGSGFSRDRGGDRGGPGGSSGSGGPGGGSFGSSSGSSGDRGSSGGSRFSGFSRGGDRSGADSSKGSSSGSSGSSGSSSTKSEDAKPAETKSDESKPNEETKPAAESKTEEAKPAADAKPGDAT